MGHSHNVKDSDANFTINPTTMEIVNNSAKNKMMQGDHNSEIYSFEITQIVEGHEMILCNKIRIHFINISSDKADQSKGVANAENIRIDSAKNMLVFEWKVSGDATKYQGSLNFRIEFACSDENNVRTYAKWTEIHKGITIGEGFDNAEGYIEEHKDILAQWKADLESEIKNYEALEKKIPTKMSQLEQDVELGSKAFIINVTGSGTEDDPYVSDKTFEEIKQAYDDGRELKCILDGNIIDEDGSDIYYESVPFDCTCLCEYGFVFVSYYEINSGISASILIDVNTQVMARYSIMFLNTANSFTYTPTQDYHPATKKYVDDAVKGSLEHGKTKRELVATIFTFTKHTTSDDGYVISYGDFILPNDVELNLDGNDETDDFEVEFNYNVSGYISRVVVKRNEFSLYKNTSGIYHFLIEKMTPTINISPYITKSAVNSTMHCGISFGRSFDGLDSVSSGFVWSDLSVNLRNVKVYKITK